MADDRTQVTGEPTWTLRAGDPLAVGLLRFYIAVRLGLGVEIAAARAAGAGRANPLSADERDRLIDHVAAFESWLEYQTQGPAPVSIDGDTGQLVEHVSDGCLSDGCLPGALRDEQIRRAFS